METLATSTNHPLYSKLKAWGLKPLVLDFYVQRVWPTFSLERIFAKVRSVKPAAANVVTIRLRPNFHFKNFEAGQHVLVTTSVRGQRLSRTYSPTQLRDGSLEITVKQIEGGKVSTQLARFVKRGTSVEISRPFGEMTWSKLPSSSRTVLCAGGVGMTPLRSLIRAWDEKGGARVIALHYWARTELDFCFRAELEEIVSRRPNLELHFYASDRGQVQLRDVIGNDAGVVLACGPEGFVQAARAVAKLNGQTFFGEHGPMTVSESTHSEETFFDITYDGQVIKASSTKTILESLEEQGIAAAHGCRMGLCKSCTCLKTAGSTFSSRDQALATESNEEIQICVSSPRSPLTLEKY